MTGPEADAAAQLLERLLTEPDFRARFRRDPVTASREAGLETVAEEMAQSAGKAMETLDVRESRSSLAGVLMAAALEGVGVYEFSNDLVPHLADIPSSVGQVLSRVELPSFVDEAQAATPSSGHSSASDAGEFRAITPDQVAAAHSAAAAPDALELLQNKRVTFDADGVADMRAGKMDSRMVAVLSAISREHKITVSATASDHDRLTSGGSVSNHFHGRAVDIASVDGKPVNPGNAAARELAEELSRLDPAIRPTEIGSPWALPGAAYFTDGAHQDHIHIGFDDPSPSAGAAPEDLAAEQAAPADDDVGDEEEPGGREDPGGDTDAEADQESDGDDPDDNDSVSDDPSDEQEEDEEDEADEDDGGDDGDHDDNSDGTPGSGGEQDDGGDGGDGEAAFDLSGAGDYPGDDAPREEIAAWMGSEAEKRGVPAELPVMAALVESNLQNLDHGDADSVGYFQMRAGIWNQGDYEGYPERGELQLKWFLDHAVAVKGEREAAGKPVDDPASYGDWIADVERPAAQYRGRYQLRLEEARDLLRQGAENRQDGSGALLEPVGGEGGGGGPRALAAVAEAKRYLGTPYRWGGSTPQTGFDCSGLVQWAYAKAGIEIPRTTQQQILASNGRPVDRAHLRPGDLVFFRNSSGDVHHVGMSLGGDKFINAPHTGDVVKIASLKESYYASEFAGGRRFDMAGARAQAAAAAVGGEAAASGGSGSPPGVDPDAVVSAEAALARDAAEVQRPGTLLFEAVRAQEVLKARDLAAR